MADSKITALTALTAADPANDMIPIVDVSDTPPASGNTKRISINNILACSPSATLASATISGNLTVDTNTLFVDSTNNRVGIRTASPAEPLTVDNSSGVTTGAIRIYATDQAHSRLSIQNTNGQAFHLVAGNPGVSNAGFALYDNTGAATRWYVDSTGVHTWQNVGGVAGTAMTLNSTGLGVGEAASVSRLQARGSTTDSSAYILYGKASSGNVICFMRNDGRFLVGNGTTDNFIVTETGNVGVGVTPSTAWNTGGNIQVGVLGALYHNQTLGATDLTYNSIRTGTDTYQYLNGSSLQASRFQQRDGTFRWFNAPAGTSPNAITFTQAMTLTAGGELLVGTTTNGGNGVSIRPSTTAPNVVLVGSDTSGGTAFQLYSTGTSSNRFFVTWAGTVNAVSATISAISDARLKENVQDIDVGLGAILSLKPRKFDWKAGKGKDIKGDRGFIAQEFEQVFPQLVDDWADPAPEGEAPYKSVRQDLIPVLVKAIQELAAEVNALKNA
jgi:hypothetical protein